MAAQRKKVLQRSEPYKRAREEVEKLGSSAREWRRDRAVMMRSFPSGRGELDGAD